ncbi:MAG: hypothetical protein ACYDAA_08675 [Syntrophales bacterium]
MFSVTNSVRFLLFHRPALPIDACPPPTAGMHRKAMTVAAMPLDIGADVFSQNATEEGGLK